ncbi:MAG: endonuclease III [Clostridia bacterium]|nr:endonuclease III [Clostridia bacterium]
MNKTYIHLKDKAKEAILRLEKIYPEAKCALEHSDEPWRLMIMARLSAQCTDMRVNEVCRTLFEKYPTPESLAEASLSDVEAIVRPCGLYRVKAHDIISECRLLISKYGGRVPDTMDELLEFDGVGRKVANLLLGDVHGLPAVVVDTHCMRITKRLGLVSEDIKDPHKIELVLKELLPPEKQSDFCHRIVDFGRDTCDARRPDCQSCALSDICDYFQKMS